MTRDLVHAIKVTNCNTVQQVNTTDPTATVIDRNGYASLTFLIATGTLSNTVAEVEIDHSDSSSSGFAEVEDSDLIGADTGDDLSIAATDDDQVWKVGYVGAKRYVRPTLKVTTQNNTGGTVSILALLGHPEDFPTDDQHS